MFHTETYSGSREKNYDTLIRQLEALIAGETNAVANMANASALLHQFLQDINWVGFYVTEGNELVLGPFQGLPACVRIPFGRGVCGTAAATKNNAARGGRTSISWSYRVRRSFEFRNRRAVNQKNGEVIGVLDIDSPSKKSF
ncbi:GAF domain-containing protein [Ectobacillus funiculus]